MNAERRGWHVGREVSLPGILALLGQTIAIVWFLAVLDSKVNQVVLANAKLEAEVKLLSTTVTIPTALNAAKIATIETNLFTTEQRLREVVKELDAVRAEQARRAPFIPKRPQ